MNQLRGLAPKRIANNIDIEIQIADWDVTTKADPGQEDGQDGHEDGDGDGQDGQDPAPISASFLMRAYGNTIKGTSVTLNIDGFPPHFYISIPEDWNIIKTNMLIKTLKNKMPFYNKKDIISHDIVRRKKFWGFTNNKRFQFIRILFKTTQGL